MTDERDLRTKRPVRRSDPRAFRRFLEEMSWLLSTYQDLDFRMLADASMRPEFLHGGIFDRHLSERRSAATNLVGVLPHILVDEKLFPSNEDISDFAEEVLRVSIPRWSKKSKYELIGHIVCHVSMAEDKRLERVVRALDEISKNKTRASEMIVESKKKGLSWGQLIQQLADER